MSRRLKGLLPLLLLACLPALADAAAFEAPRGFVQAKGTRLVDAEGRTLHLRGINLGNWLVPEGYMWRFKRDESPHQIEDIITQLVGDDEARRFWEQWRERYVTAEDIRRLGALGLNSVRLPLHHKLFVSVGDDGKPVFNGPGWALVDRLVGWCRDSGLHVILDLHAAPGGQTGTNIDDSPGFPFLFESQAAQDLTVRLWSEMARRYKDEPVVLGYDLLNEPIAHFFDTARLNPRLEPFYRRLVTAIREIDPHHVIFLGGAQWNFNFEVFGPPFAPNLVYTFHTYWSDPTAKTIQSYLDFRDKHGVPLWLGESGENQDAWIQTFRTLLDSQEIGWCFWPHKKLDSKTGLYSVTPPAHWSDILAYTEAAPGTHEQRRKARPSLEVSRQALAELLENIDVAKCRLNTGYADALGLKVP